MNLSSEALCPVIYRFWDCFFSHSFFTIYNSPGSMGKKKREIVFEQHWMKALGMCVSVFGFLHSIG